MNPTEARPLKVVAALDVSKLADAVIQDAIDFATRQPGSELHLLTVSPSDTKANLGMLHRNLETVARAHLAATPASATLKTKVHVRPGDPVEQIAALVFEVEADLLVLGAGATDPASPRLGKVASKVVEHSPCAVLLVREADYGPHPLRAKQCPKCVAVRAESDGERWFCDEHTEHGSLTSMILSPHVDSGLGGGLML